MPVRMAASAWRARTAGGVLRARSMSFRRSASTTPMLPSPCLEWEAGDVIYIPPNTIHQHFNADPQRPARLISAINRIYKYCGLNDLEQLEDAPEYDAKTVLNAELMRRYLTAAIKEPA